MKSKLVGKIIEIISLRVMEYFRQNGRNRWQSMASSNPIEGGGKLASASNYWALIGQSKCNHRALIGS